VLIRISGDLIKWKTLIEETRMLKMYHEENPKETKDSIVRWSIFLVG
jgi:hypothetical protein